MKLKSSTKYSNFFIKASGDDDLLQQALALSLTQQDDKSHGKPPDLSSMTEEEQLHYALQMSLNAPAASSTSASNEKQTPDTEMKEVRKRYLFYFQGKV